MFKQFEQLMKLAADIRQVVITFERIVCLFIQYMRADVRLRPESSAGAMRQFISAAEDRLV